MEKLLISRYIKLFEVLSLDIKLELLSRLTESIKKGIEQNKKSDKELINELSGSWKDVDDNIIDEIYSSRTVSSRTIDLD